VSDAAAVGRTDLLRKPPWGAWGAQIKTGDKPVQAKTKGRTSAKTIASERFAHVRLHPYQTAETRHYSMLVTKTGKTCEAGFRQSFITSTAQAFSIDRLPCARLCRSLQAQDLVADAL
jgi:hypothetical protein